MRKLIAAIALILIISGCTTTQMTYKIRHHKNRIAQETIQYQNSISSGKDWSRSYRNWDRRPHGSWPFEFLQ